MIWLDRISRKLARSEQSARVRIARELVRAIRERTRRTAELQREINALVEAQAPELLELPGCGTLTAAKLLAETAGVGRFASDAKLARLAGVAPDPGLLRQPRSVIASIAAATVNSTVPCIASPSPKAAAMPQHVSSSPESKPRASREWRLFVA